MHIDDFKLIDCLMLQDRRETRSISPFPDLAIAPDLASPAVPMSFASIICYLFR